MSGLVVSEELGNKQTDRLTDRHALLYSIRITVKEEFESSKLFGEEFWCSGEAKRILFVKSTSNITRILIMKYIYSREVYLLNLVYIKIIWWGGAGSKGREEANKVQSMIFTIF